MGRRFHAIVGSVVALVVLACLIGLPLTGIHVQPAQFLPKTLPFAAILAGIGYFHWRGEKKFVEGLWTVFWMALVCELHLFPMFLAGRTQVPYQDDFLAGLDRRLGLEVTQVLAWMEPYPDAKHWLNEIYFSLTPMMMVVLVLNAMTGRIRQGQEFVLSCVAAVLISFPLFAIFQAEGPWVQYGYPANAQQAEYVRVLHALKSDAVFTIDLNYKIGLITFPSFHTILAVLAAAGLWSFRRLRWLGALWAGLIIFSTMTTGWHYVADVVAGFGVAAVSLAIAKALARETETGRLLHVAQAASLCELNRL